MMLDRAKRVLGVRIPAWFACALVVAATGGMAGGKFYDEIRVSDEFAKAMAERRLEMLDDDSVRFAVTVKEFVNAVLEGKNEAVETRRHGLTSHIAAMYTRVGINRGWFDRHTRFAANAYQERIQEFRKAVLKVDGVLSMRVFWESLSALLVAQYIFLDEMNRQLSGDGICHDEPAVTGPRAPAGEKRV